VSLFDLLTGNLLLSIYTVKKASLLKFHKSKCISENPKKLLK
jgi:hypothetical protein